MEKEISKLFKTTLLTVIALFIVFTEQVEAATDTTLSKQICLPNRELYSVTWDRNKNTLVTENDINEASIERGYTKDVTGLSESEKEKYKINPVLLSSNCYTENGKVMSCPTNKELSFYNLNKILEIDEDNNYKNLVIDLNVSNGTFTVKIPDLYSGKIKVRLVNTGQERNDGTKTASAYSNYLSKQGNYYVINNVQPSKSYQKGDGSWAISNSEIILEFYINDSSSKCNGTYISTMNLVMDTINDVEIANPALTDDSYGCSSVKNYINNLLNSGIVPNNTDVEEVLKYNYASMCYTSKITYQEYLTLRQTISQQFSDLQTLIGHGADSGFSTISMSGDATCEQTHSTGEQVVTAAGGKWWSLVCKESYSVTGDHAKLVYAGAGFTYVSDFKASRTCTLKQNAVVTLKPQCVYSVSVSCSYDERAGRVTGASKGGPNEDFDSCVTSCDGGAYTQECINSCYERVYENSENTRVLPALDKDKTTSFLEDGYEIQKVANCGTITSTQGCTYTGTGTDGAGNSKDMYSCSVSCPGGGSVEVPFSSYCDGHNGSCSVSSSVGPAGCVDDPWAVYNSELSASKGEYGQMVELMNREQANGSYTIKIADSYLNNNKVAYTYEISTENGADLNMQTNTYSDCPGGTRTWTFGNATPDSVTGCQKNTKVKEVEVELVPAYLDKKTGNAIYTNGNGRYASFNVSSASTKLQNVSFNARSAYSGGRRYYTNILSDNVNVVIGAKTVTLASYGSYFSSPAKKASIVVTVENFGTNADYNSGVNCFYGVYNSTICKGDHCDECPGCPGNPSSGNGDAIGEGITIIFRPIDLNDNFPNDRNPRWNWTSGATVLSGSSLYPLLNYKVNPVATNQEIENKGYTIYSDPAEIDYDITLTRENLANIKKYNRSVLDLNKDGYTNYLDYDMNCISRKGRDYCVSNFLSNKGGNYITYNGKTSSINREDIAKCNNTYNGACAD